MEQQNENILQCYYSRYGGYWIYPDMLDYCYLVNPYFNRSKIIDEMESNFRTLVSEYPSGLAVNSRLASECWNIKQEYIVPGNGAAELIKNLVEDFEGKVGVVRPTFEEYPNRLSNDRVVAYVPGNQFFRYDEDEIISFFSENKVSYFILINPDNPSGNFITIEGVRKIAQWCEDNNIRFILDESFVDFSIGFVKNTCLDNLILEQYPHMCVIKSISKSYGVPGLRLGILCSSDTSLVDKIKQQLSIWNINSFAQFFMQIYPKYKEDYKSACEQFIQAREDFAIELASIPYIRVMPSQANYFFVEVLPPFTPIELCERLLKEYNILASACLAKKGIEPNRYMRIAIRNHSDNAKFIVALKSIVR